MYEAFFLPGSQGALFAIYHPPAADVPKRGGVLYAPPFAEEMNKARRMAALQARQLAAAGFGVLILDPYGCGDSAGDFTDARWDLWRDDLLLGRDWLLERGHDRLLLWGLRLGALLAAELANEIAARRLVLWQPVLDGERFLHQFLRLRLTADRLKGSDETMTRLQATLAAGQTLDVSGYELTPQLAAAIQKAYLRVPSADCRVDWFELVSAADRPLSPVSQRLVNEWRASGVTVHFQTVVGEAFWATQEIAVVPDLLAATLAALIAE